LAKAKADLDIDAILLLGRTCRLISLSPQRTHLARVVSQVRTTYIPDVQHCDNRFCSHKDKQKEIVVCEGGDKNTIVRLLNEAMLHVCVTDLARSIPG
jgi:hypothetical protein